MPGVTPHQRLPHRHTPFGYAGSHTDPTGLVYLINRYYDPTFGQFSSVDPLVETTGQPYAYADGNPAIVKDPDGVSRPPQALVSWAGLTPTARQSGPRKGRGKKGHGNTYAKRIAVLAAYAAANTDTFPCERFRLASRPGGGRKNVGCAVGRSILIIVWHLLNDPAARYRDLGSDWHARHTDRSRKARNARRQLEALSYDVIMSLRRTPPDPAASNNP
jgi:RHS repeat-associated protein